ncbi:hypothetical protein POL68_31055 [Stigmatella sp. ncwal1]|uniref:Uncharacterized protein n=1 Tax=Stigmatella ashevillensis TaxID=2995309 RepID=A0ABT5DGZ7_9BACT|nr:hypothetical protein [Stigmatella ashevillena]MDC0712942.1 hypothetical protein [Stigmatella ashevillena]
MAILGNLLSALGISSRRHYSRGSSLNPYGRGYRRAHTPGFFGGSLGRMTLGGIAAYLTRGYMNRRRVY